MTVKEEPQPPTAIQIRGGLRLTVDGERVLRHQNEAFEWREWQPEYIGDFLCAEVDNLLTAVARLRSDETDLYDVVEMRFEATNWYLAFEKLTGGYVRVAGRLYPPDESEELKLVPQSERGYLVTSADLYREAIDCGESFLERSASFGHGSDDGTAREIRATLEELRE